MRQKISIEQKDSGSVRFLYRTAFGRVVLRLLIRPWVSKAVGGFMSSFLSKPMIKGFVRKNGIDLNEYKGAPYKSYNDFFTRKIMDGGRPFDASPDALCAPCDSALSVYEITPDSRFLIKNGSYSVASLTGSEDMAKEFEGGLCLVFRLAVTDYHRYAFFDSGTAEDSRFIKGVLHTVRPIALERFDFYKENCREVTRLHTDNFGDAVQVEVGAMCVGKIVNNGKKNFLRSEEKGYFMFGGSTVVLLLKKDAAEIDSEITTNTAWGFETKVTCGEKIGNKKHP